LSDDLERIHNVAVVLGPGIICGVFGLKTVDASVCRDDSDCCHGVVGKDAW